MIFGSKINNSRNFHQPVEQANQNEKKRNFFSLHIFIFKSINSFTVVTNAHVIKSYMYDNALNAYTI